jgi:hypothetical protein
MPFRILITLKDQTVKEDPRIYYGSVPMPRELITLEIDGHLLRVRVTAITGGAKENGSGLLVYRVLAIEL